MSRLKQALHNDLQALELLRDECVLQAHLFQADARSKMQELEQRWNELKVQLQRAQTVAAGAESEVEIATGLLMDSLKAGYADLRRVLKP